MQQQIKSLQAQLDWADKKADRYSELFNKACNAALVKFARKHNISAHYIREYEEAYIQNSLGYEEVGTVFGIVRDFAYAVKHLVDGHIEGYDPEEDSD